LEYGGAGWNALFAQRKNIFSRPYWTMLLEMDRFNKTAVKVLDNPKYLNTTVAQFVKEERYGEDFTHKFLIPMSSAIWSTEPNQMLQFPIITLVRFFKNHGFLGLKGHFQWRTVKGGSRMYRDKIMSHFKGKVLLNQGVKRIERKSDAVTVSDDRGFQRDFDKVIFACNAPEALGILDEGMSKEKVVLKNFRYQKNRATLHTDALIMPKSKRAWSSWNYRLTKDVLGKQAATTIYDMNNLQNVSQHKNYFVSINDPGEVDPLKIIWETLYEHPIYDVRAVEAQKELPKLNQNGQTYFCGAYFNYGFHEDGLVSGKNVAETILKGN
jgi:predicted NAD/FAD-binding protein